MLAFLLAPLGRVRAVRPGLARDFRTRRLGSTDRRNVREHAREVVPLNVRVDAEREVGRRVTRERFHTTPSQSVLLMTDSSTRDCFARIARSSRRIVPRPSRRRRSRYVRIPVTASSTRSGSRRERCTNMRSPGGCSRLHVFGRRVIGGFSEQHGRHGQQLAEPGIVKHLGGGDGAL